MITTFVHLLLLVSYPQNKKLFKRKHFSLNQKQAIRVKMSEKKSKQSKHSLIKKSHNKERLNRVKKRLFKQQISVTSLKKQKSSGQRKSLSAYISHIRDTLEKNKIYPTIARKLKQQGTVVVQFTIGSQGIVKKYNIKKTSSFPILNTASLKSIKAIKAFSPFPKDMKKSDIVVQIPLSYKLI
jgi:protein TonB